MLKKNSGHHNYLLHLPRKFKKINHYKTFVETKYNFDKKELDAGASNYDSRNFFNTPRIILCLI
jgi:hypothetical protein